METKDGDEEKENSGGRVIPAYMLSSATLLRGFHFREDQKLGQVKPKCNQQIKPFSTELQKLLASINPVMKEVAVISDAKKPEKHSNLFNLLSRK